MITITQSIAGRHFSANIPDLVFSISDDYAQVTMKIDEEEIYSETLFPIEGVIEVADLAELVEPYARRQLVCELQITIEAGETTETESCEVVFSEADVSTTCDDFCVNHFLSLMMGPRVTAIGRLEYLHYIGSETATAVAFYDDSTTQNFELEAVAGNDKYKTIDVSAKQFCVEDKSLLAYTIIAGNRSQTYNIDEDNPDCAPVLLFVNSFGVEELLYCTGTHSVDPKYTRDSMYVGKQMRNIKIQETRTMKADTGVLTYEEAMWAEDLFRSKQVRIVIFNEGEPNVGREVVITDAEAKRDNNDESMPRFTFSYQYAQRNHNVLDLQREGRIFDNTFDNTFN